MPEDSKRIAFLRGKRVYLRPVLKEDIPHFLRWTNDEEVIKYLGAYLPVMEKEEEQWFEDMANRKQTDLVFAIVTVDRDKIIGSMGIHRINWKDRNAFTGALIGEKEYWDKGYGTEAKMLLLNYAFNTLNLRKICSSVIVFNKRSYAYQLKCGYVEEGRRRGQCYRGGRYWDEILTAVFKKNWRPLWKEYKKKYLS